MTLSKFLQCTGNSKKLYNNVKEDWVEHQKLVSNVEVSIAKKRAKKILVQSTFLKPQVTEKEDPKQQKDTSKKFLWYVCLPLILLISFPFNV